MPKESHLPEYENEIIVKLIKNWIHDKDDRKMLYWHLIDGDTIQEITDKIGKDRKTVWTHLKEGKIQVFSHYPEKEDGN